MEKLLFFCLAICINATTVSGQEIEARLPIIDMHLHAMKADEHGPPPSKIGIPFENFGSHDPKNEYTSTVSTAFQNNSWTNKYAFSPLTDDSLRIKTIRILEQYNIYAVTSGDIDLVRTWYKESPERIIKGITWGFNSIKDKGLSLDALKGHFKSGEFRVFGELLIQYEGFSPNDPVFDPFFSMAEELDIPVGIHIGPGPPGAILLGSPGYRASLHSPFVLEETLVKHPKLRIYAMHTGWPMLDDMIAMMYAHPQLYVDLGYIIYGIPEKEFYFYLERMVNAGFIKRIMFGSDNMIYPETIKAAIERIQHAKFLTEDQKRDIFFNNACRFLRLSERQIEEMKKK